MSLYKIGKQEAMSKYLPLIEEATGLSRGMSKRTDQLLEWLPVYLHNHRVNETPKKNQLFEAAELGSTPGMGSVLQPGAPTALVGADRFGQAPGSGDRPSSLSLAIQIAAQTVGLDLLPSVPMDTPYLMHHFLDVIYAGGTTTGTQTPFLINLTSVTKAQAANLVPGQSYDLTVGTVTVPSKMRFISRSRINGGAVFQVLGRKITVGGVDQTVADVFAQGASAAGNATIVYGTAPTDVIEVGNSSPDYVKALEDHVSGFSGLFGLESPADADGFNFNKPYDRSLGESTQSRSLGMKFYSQAVEAGTWNVDISLTREMVQDARQFGYDILSQAKAALANEATQSMNKHILDFIFELGVQNHKQIFDTEGMHFNINWDDTTSGPIAYNLGYSRNGSLETINANTPVAKATTGGETLMTAQRRILDQILFAANEISHRGRFGAGDTAVISTHVATVLQSIRGFVTAPMSNTINQVAGSLRPVGSIAGVEFYTDPNMKLSDKRVCVFRKGNGSTPGATIFPYVLGDVVEIIAEGTMGPKMQLKSRYALDTVGHNPQTNYITFDIHTSDEYGSLLR